MYRGYRSKMAVKKVLIVFAHQNFKSFNGALVDVARKALETKGYTVEVSDLYEQHFEPRATEADFTGTHDVENFSYPSEQTKAVSNGTLRDDIAQEMEKIKRADLIIFQFPVYWFSVPAILKGWFDRILISGFAYKFPKIYDEGLMKGKRAILSFTTGSPSGMFTSHGLHGDINISLWPIQYGTLRFCGFDVLHPQMSFSPQFADCSQREKMLQDWNDRLQNIFDEEPMKFVSIKNFDPTKRFAMNDDSIEMQNGKKVGPMIGHHSGKSIPTNSPA